MTSRLALDGDAEKQTERHPKRHASHDEYSIQLVRRVCQAAGDFHCINHARADLKRHGVNKAVRTHDSRPLFDWLMNTVSYQGISDRAAAVYIEQHGQASWRKIANTVRSSPRCPKLRGYWCFDGCRYEKNKTTCAEPKRIQRCPLPRLDLRNGRLNQTAYSLFFFVRDVAQGDLVAWIDHQLSDETVAHESLALHEALIAPMRCIFGVSDKVLNMALSTLLIGARRSGSRWFEVGSRMVVIDSLVHNFLHRTGILRRLDAEHSYGPLCYEGGFCAEIATRLSSVIDASEFNREFPKDFPRFVQHAIWRYCAQDEWNVCNGVRVRDGKRCVNRWCQLFQDCDRVKIPTNTRQRILIRGG
jgi:hypothetical protein